jgi:hypothetical protein
MHASAVANARQYDLILTGSTWNTENIKQYGFDNVFTIKQGVDVDVFRPRGKAAAEAEAEEEADEEADDATAAAAADGGAGGAGGDGAAAAADTFVVFSGGKVRDTPRPSNTH